MIDLSPTAWDFIFKKNESCWVIVHLKDKRKIAGLFNTDSYVSTFPNEEQIYIEEVWKLDEQNNFDKKIKRTKGILILKDEIMAVEFFN